MNLKILAQLRPAYTIRHKPRWESWCFISDPSSAVWQHVAVPVPPLKLLCWSWASHCKSWWAEEEAISHVQLQGKCFRPKGATGSCGRLTELLCPTACQLLLAHPWLQGISRDLSFLHIFMSGWAYAGLKCSPTVISMEIPRYGRLVSSVDKMWNCQPWGNAAVLIIFGIFMPESFHHHIHFAVCHFPAAQQMSPQSAHTL